MAKSDSQVETEKLVRQKLQESDSVAMELVRYASTRARERLPVRIEERTETLARGLGDAWQIGWDLGRDPADTLYEYYPL